MTNISNFLEKEKGQRSQAAQPERVARTRRADTAHTTRASGLPRRGPFAHVGHSCGPRVRALCARVGRVDGLRENWFSFFHQISKCFFSNLVLS